MAATLTLDDQALLSEVLEEPVPGLILVFADGRPACVPIRIDRRPIEIGRERADGVFAIEDKRVSRRHARISLEKRGVRVTDLESRNGTFLDGRRAGDELLAKPTGVLRIGPALFLLLPDIRPFLAEGGVQVEDGAIVGPRLREGRARVARAAAAGDTVMLTGPSGSGKELAAKVFHDAGGRKGGPFIAVNCAAVPAGLAERLFFGAKRGAYSGATADAEGYVQAADGGTLFLDEVADLDASVQPKLLRVLEAREVLALGASHARKVDIRVCSATLKDLRVEVNAGRFREDLYYRIGRPEVRLPSLAERQEEIGFLVQAEIERVDPRLTQSAPFLEACVMRAWPGNVRELLSELRVAARAAIDAQRTILEAKDLSPTAGQEMAAPVSPPKAAEPTREAIEGALQREQGNVTRAAKALGIHRNQLRRWLTKHDVDAKAFGGAGGDETEF